MPKLPGRGKKSAKKTQTVRERQEKADKVKPRRIRRTASAASRPVRWMYRLGKREMYMPMPNNRPGNFLNKRRRVIPRYFRDSFKELKFVTWPSNRTTFQLTLAVFIFAIALGLVIALADYGLDLLFKKVLLT